MVAQLTQIGEVLPGYQLRAAVDPQSEGRYALVRLGDVTFRGVRWIDLPRMDLEFKAERSQIVDGDMLFRSRGSSFGAGVASGIEGPTIALAPLYIFHGDPNIILPEFVALWINGRQGQAQLEPAAVGSGLKTVSIRAFEALEVPVLPLELQAKCVELEQLNCQIGDFERALAQKRSDLIERRIEEAVLKASRA